MDCSLRLIVNGQCNFRCFHCYQEGISYGAHRRFDHGTFVGLAANLNAVEPLRKIRITGGEPLIYDGLLALLKGLRCEFPSLDIGFTTNASVTNRLAEVVCEFAEDPVHMSISLPSLKAETFERITRSDKYSDVMSSIEYLLAHGCRSAVNINFVLIPGVNGSELSAMANFARTNHLCLKVICLTINAFNRERIESFGVESRAVHLIEEQIEEIGYTKVKLDKACMSGRHHVRIINCFGQQAVPYFHRFRTLRIYYDGRVAVNGDYDGIIRPIDLNDPKGTFREILGHAEECVKSAPNDDGLGYMDAHVFLPRTHRYLRIPEDICKSCVTTPGWAV